MNDFYQAGLEEVLKCLRRQVLSFFILFLEETK